ncbi:MAG: gamma-glutamylcyclotransferase family protein [Methyloceanibacter sp.]|uniref:gamma-glutamylcyclotransferase family protein n=1 Tax=Methyloceanibacter sp. TaxID=1965321 RepID=UPI003D6C97A1
MKEPNHLFVYGTLRHESPHPMARRLRTQARLVGKGSVPGRLYDMGWYPAGVHDAGEKRRRIIGDVYALKPDSKLLAELDAYEAIGVHYRRVPVEVKLATGGTIHAWAYLFVAESPRLGLIESGDFIAHRNAKTPRPVRP